MAEVIDLTALDEASPRQDHTSQASAYRRVRRRNRELHQYSSAYTETNGVIFLDCEQPRTAPSGAAAAAGPQPPTEASNVDDVQIIKVAGSAQVWNRDLPHRRDQCGVHPFQHADAAASTTAGPLNMAHCQQCYCVVCDCAASSCTRWPEHCDGPCLSAQLQPRRSAQAATASGLARAEAGSVPAPTVEAPSAAASGATLLAEPQLRHSNAQLDRASHMAEIERGNEAFRYLMGAHSTAAAQGPAGCASSAGPCGTPALAGPLPYSQHQGPGYPSTHPAAASASQEQAAQHYRVPAPDAALLAHLLFLGTIRLPFQVQGGDPASRLAELQQNLWPYGTFYYPPAGDWNFVHLHTLQQHVQLLPLPMPTHVQAPRSTWLQTITVHYMDGRSLPVLCGVQLGCEGWPHLRMSLLCMTEQLAALNLWDNVGEEADVIKWSGGNMTKLHGDACAGVTVASPAKAHYHVCVRPRTAFKKTCHVFMQCSISSRPRSIGWVDALPDARPVPITLVLNLGRQSPCLGVTAYYRLHDALRSALAPYVAAGKQLPVENFAALTVTRTLTTVKPGWTPQFYQEHISVQLNEEALAALQADSQRPLHVVHPTADQKIYEENEANAKVQDVFHHLQTSCKALPSAIIRTLRGSCNTQWLSSGGEVANPYFVELSLEPMASPTSCPAVSAVKGCHYAEPHGVAVLKVYTYKPGTADTLAGQGSIITDLGRKADARGNSSTAKRAAWHDVVNKCSNLFEYWMMGAQSVQQALLGLQAIRIEAHQLCTLKDVVDCMVPTEKVGTASQPRGLAVTLRPYQLESLHFMLQAELRPGGFRSLLWYPHKAENHRMLWYSPALKVVVDKEPETCTGGLLCDQMGLGKTVEVLALILAHPPPPLHHPLPAPRNGRVSSRATLIVCPVSLVTQWYDELQRKSLHDLGICLYHGGSRERNPQFLAHHDIVITSYNTLAADHQPPCNKRKAGAGNEDAKPARTISPPPLEQIHWFRIILDECHVLKATNNNQHKAVMALHSDRRWGCTGTPITADLTELKGQFAAIRLDSLAGAGFDCLRPYQYHEGARAALVHVLRSVCIRHRKESCLSLPPVTEQLVPVTLPVEQRGVYAKLYSAAKQRFGRIQSHGPDAVSRAYIEIMALLQPLRRICSGGMLTAKELSLPAERCSYQPEAEPSAAAPMRVAPQEECAICLSEFDQPMRTLCKHWFCKECIEGYLASKHSCPMCRATTSVVQLVPGVTAAEKAAQDAAHAAAEAARRGQHAASSEGLLLLCDSKLQVLLSELHAMRLRSPSSKALVFSQWSSMLEWLGPKLQEHGFQYTTITGSMPPLKRQQAIDSFQRAPPTTIFLLSSRTGSVGINLTAATHVFIMDAFLNQAHELQAVGRAHRMGQTRPVTVKKLYIKGSIEERIMELHRARSTPGGFAAAEHGSARRRLCLAEQAALFAAHTVADVAA